MIYVLFRKLSSFAPWRERKSESEMSHVYEEIQDLRSPAENEKMAIGRWISTAVTRSHALSKQPSCPRVFLVRRYFSKESAK